MARDRFKGGPRHWRIRRIATGSTVPLAMLRATCHAGTMTNRSQVDALYAEVVALADQARGWFDGPGVEWRQQLPVADQAAVAVETLATTTRLLAMVAWVLDPARQDEQDRAPFLVDTGGTVPAAMSGTPGGEIATRARMLAARLAALSTAVPAPQPPPLRPVLSASYEGVWRA